MQHSQDNIMEHDLTDLNFVTSNKFNIFTSTPTDPLHINIADGQLLMDFTTEIPKTFNDRKFSSLTQRRKKVVDRYIVEVLGKSHEYDYGEFGSQLWCALLLEYFRQDNDQVGIDSIMHWTHTSWGRRMKKAYQIGLLGLKEGLDPVREFENAKKEAFRKRSPSSSPQFPDENCVTKSRGRRRKLTPTFSEPNPHAVNALHHDHDYCKNPWLEPFGEIVVELPNYETSIINQHSTDPWNQSIIDLGCIGAEEEI